MSVGAGLYVNSDVGRRPIAGTQLALDDEGDIVPLSYAHAPINEEIDLDSVAPADATSAHAMDALDTVRREDDLGDFPLDLGAKALLGQLIEGGAKDAPAHVDDEETHDACSQWLEEEPALAEEDSPSDTEEYGDECQRITAVVEGLGLEC